MIRPQPGRAVSGRLGLSTAGVLQWFQGTAAPLRPLGQALKEPVLQQSRRSHSYATTSSPLSMLPRPIAAPRPSSMSSLGLRSSTASLIKRYVCPSERFCHPSLIPGTRNLRVVLAGPLPYGLCGPGGAAGGPPRKALSQCSRQLWRPRHPPHQPLLVRPLQCPHLHF